jgi:acyl phosphate:glycerol-3-phosphate acyltransferase
MAKDLGYGCFPIPDSQAPDSSMPLPIVAILLLLASYLVGAIPFGYVIGRLRGVNLFAAGSGNIGATNAARVLGARWGMLVFVLDLLKGIVPCAAIVPLARLLIGDGENVPEVFLQVGAAALAFLGHLFPVYLGFRGGKGVATGAGTILVLVPGPAALAILFWVATLLASRTVSLASLVAVAVLVSAYLLGTPAPFSAGMMPTTIYLIASAVMVLVKHRENIKRLLHSDENTIRDFTARQPLLRTFHILALGFWFGGAGFFNFLAAPAIFASFKQVVYAGPSDRTAYETIIPAEASTKQKDALASALAGSAVGPVFPRYFAMQTVCGLLALITALSWWKGEEKIHRWRVVVITLAVLTVVIGWPISNHVSELRLLRFSPEAAIASAATADFTTWHLISLFLSFVTVCLAGIALAMTAWLPREVSVTLPRGSEEQKVLVS